MTDQQLQLLIDRYFDGDLTPIEEGMLRRYLLSRPLRDQLAVETLGVMSAVNELPRVKGDVRFRPRSSRIAASITIFAIVGLAATLFYSNRESEWNSGSAIAYVEGRKISNNRQIDDILRRQFSDVAQCANAVNLEMESEFLDIRNALNSDCL